MRTILAAFLAAAIFGVIGSNAAIQPAAIFSDHMVVQRDAPLAIWGTAAPDAALSVSFRDAKIEAKADKEGNWEAKLPAGKAGGPFTILLDGDGRVEIQDVLVGDVWFCSGQSNMALAVSETANAEAEIAAARDTGIRLFKVTKVTPAKPVETFAGSWAVTSPDTVGAFNGVGYYFAREYRKTYPDVPVGILSGSWGGTAIEAWLPREIQEKDPEMKVIVSQLDELQRRYPAEKKIYTEEKAKWDKEVQTAKASGQHAPAPPIAPKGRPQAGVGVLYNGMIYPLRRYAIRGVLWYQGENNIEAAALYAKQFPALIANWRALWQQPDLPFFFVQLAGVGRAGPGETDGWAWLREAQASGLKLPHTAMALAIDIGDQGINTHPKNKQEVGRRLCLIVRQKLDGESVASEGPVFKTCVFEGSKARIGFDGKGSHLATVGGGPLTGFVMAGKDKVFHRADATIEGDSVMVSSSEVTDPVAVRYAWSNLGNGSLIDSDGLPAAPFRTDAWSFADEALAMSLFQTPRHAKAAAPESAPTEQ